MDNFKHIQAKAQEIKVNPPIQTWSKIEQKLDANNVKEKQSIIKLVSKYALVAASFLVLIGSISFVYLESNYKLKIDEGRIAHWENLDTASESIISTSLVHQLNSAYKGN